MKSQNKNKERLVKLDSSNFRNKILNWDFRNLIRFYKIDTKYTILLRIFSFFGSYPAFILFMLAFMLYGDFKDITIFKIFGYMQFTAGVLLSLIFLTVPKHFVGRNRPYNDNRFLEVLNIDIRNRDPEFGRGRTQSFPSGHVFFWGFQLIILPHIFGYWTLVVSIPIIILMAITRMHLGCHFPSDVILGAILGVLCGIITIAFFDNFFYPFYIHLWKVIDGDIVIFQYFL